jgi:hypothetical protein
MRITFPSPAVGVLTYNMNGVTVTKNVTRHLFGTHPICDWSIFDRSIAANAQDLWWNPSEPGWGLNIAQQDDILFATLFTYAADGRGMWLVMSNGTFDDATGGYSGTLFRTTGPAFNASPWTPATTIPVGTMALTFSRGNAGTLKYSVNGVTVTKPIERSVFATPTTECRAPFR